MSDVSVPGSLFVPTPNVQETPGIQAAINMIVADPDTQSAIHSSVTQAPYLGDVLDVYELTPTYNGEGYTLQANESVAFLEGSYNASLTGVASTGTAANPFLFVGNEGNDTITTGTGSTGYVFLGDGSNTLNVSAGDNASVTAGHGTDTISLAGNDTLTLGTGKDTVTANGTATVYGGTGMDSITGGPGSFSYFGSASPTAYDTVVGGSGTNFFEGGAGNDTLVGGYNSSTAPHATDLFTFANDSTAGGSHDITNFHTGADTIALNGYSVSDITSFQTGTGSSTIKLSDGTSISVDSNLNEHLTGGSVTFT